MNSFVQYVLVLDTFQWIVLLHRFASEWVHCRGLRSALLASLSPAPKHPQPIHSMYNIESIKCIEYTVYSTCIEKGDIQGRVLHVD